MKLYDKGIYLLNGREIIEDGPDAAAILAQKGITDDKAEAAKGTIAYNILKAQDKVRQDDVSRYHFRRHHPDSKSIRA